MNVKQNIICNAILAFKALCYILSLCQYRILSTRNGFVYYILLQVLQWNFLSSLVADLGKYFVCFIRMSFIVDILFACV
jgi:hypothetical protein